MRVVYLRSNPVNPDSRVEKEVNSLIKFGHEVVVLGWDRANDYDWKKEILTLPNGEVDIYRIGIKATFGGGMKNLKALYAYEKTIYKWLKTNSGLYDCIHAADLDTGYVAQRISKNLKKKYVYDIYDYYPAAHHFPSVFQKMVVKAEKQTINNAEFTILCTDQRLEQIKGSNPKKIIIIHNSPSRDILLKAEGSFQIASAPNHTIKIGYVGILSRARLLEEIVTVVSKNKDFEFHVGGFGQLESYFLEVSQKYDNIYFYGKLKYGQTLQLEQQVDVLTSIYDPAVPNHKYAAPNKFYESLMLGKPVIMVHNTGVDNIVDKYNLGATIDFSKEGFENALIKLRSEKESWNEIAKRENELFDSQLSWDIMEKRLAEGYSSINL